MWWTMTWPLSHARLCERHTLYPGPVVTGKIWYKCWQWHSGEDTLVSKCIQKCKLYTPMNTPEPHLSLSLVWSLHTCMWSARFLASPQIRAHTHTLETLESPTQQLHTHTLIHVCMRGWLLDSFVLDIYIGTSEPLPYACMHNYGTTILLQPLW